MIKGNTAFTTFESPQKKLETVLTSPAVLKVFKLQCDLFSLAEIKAFKDGNEVSDPILDKLKRPNPFQTQRQFMWDFMFWNMFGASYFEAGSKVITPDNNFYWLNTARVEFPRELQYKLDKQYWSKQVVESLGEEKVIYHYIDGTSRDIRLKTLQVFADLTNGINNWYSSNSALDALYKVVSNSEAALNAKNINIEFSGKYMVGGDATSENIYEMPLNKQERKSLEDVATSSKKVTAVKSQINISRFVDNIAQLELDKAYFSDYYTIGKMYNIPKDVLEANLDRGATFENQEKARGSHVAYTLQPKGEDFGNGMEIYFDLDVDIKLSWEHLPFMAIFEKQKAQTNKLKADTFNRLVTAGATPESAAEMLGMDLQFNPINTE